MKRNYQIIGWDDDAKSHVVLWSSGKAGLLSEGDPDAVEAVPSEKAVEPPENKMVKQARRKNAKTI